ncbi:MAG: putative membrane protein (4 TMH) [Parcubacteria bacterium C7867-001]|nr:MAG: putative membrane protein (4 TMH) [Parcubacteria bacterium C7867-001]
MRTHWLFGALFLSVLLAGLEMWAIENYLFWRYVWFDIPMHYLGGIAIAVFVLALLKRDRSFLFLLVVTAAYLGWEIFEYVYGLPREANYVLDTIQDLVMDSMGGLTAYVVAHFSLWRSN